jgi:hypothetical protein
MKRPIYLRILGVLLILAAVPAAWFAFTAVERIQALESDIESHEAQVNMRMTREQADQVIVPARQELDEKIIQRNVLIPAAALALAVGVGLTLLPSSRKKPVKAGAAPGPD